jgi:hypothetical protein
MIVARLTFIVAALLGLALAMPTKSHAAGVAVNATLMSNIGSNKFFYKADAYGLPLNRDFEVCVEVSDVAGRLPILDPCRPISSFGSYPLSEAICRAPGLVLLRAFVRDTRGNIYDSDYDEGPCGLGIPPLPVPGPVPKFVPPLLPAPFCIVQYNVVVPQQRSESSTLRVAYADGTTEERSVPTGIGLAEFSFRREFPHGFGVRKHVILASIVETGAYDLAYVAHPDPVHPAPPLLGDDPPPTATGSTILAC